MSDFNFPENEKQVTDRIKTDTQEQLPKFDVFFKQTFIAVLTDAYGSRVFDFYRNLEILISQIFPDTATGEFLDRWGALKKITRNPATKSSGSITIEGTVGVNIPNSTQFQNAEGLAFLSTASVDVIQIVASVLSITRTATTATVTLVDDSQPIATGITVAINGADQPEYNLTPTIVVIAADQFTYDVTGSPTTPATGTIQITFDAASVPLESVDFGQNQNLVSGSNVSISASIPGLNTTGFVQFGEIGGGTDIESNEDYRERVIDAYQNPVAQFNRDQIVRVVRSIPGNTRVFVQSPDDSLDSISVSTVVRSGGVATVTTGTNHNMEDGMVGGISGADQSEYNVAEKVLVIDPLNFIYLVTGTPTTPATGTIILTPTIPPGITRVFFTRDNDANIIPSASEVNTAKQALVDQIMPVNTASVDLIVAAPIAVPVDFTFNSITPNTSTMKDAVTNNLIALFIDETSLGQDIVEAFYESTIFQTIDPATGDKVTDFDLATPVGDIVINDAELAIIGTITFL